MFKRIVTGILALSMALSVHAKDILIGGIDRELAIKVCLTVEEGDSLIVHSRGGTGKSLKRIAACTRDKDVTFKVYKALSAAAILVLAGQKVCFNEEALIGFHSPYGINQKELIVTYGVNRIREVTDKVVGKSMVAWGYTSLEIYSVLGMSVMTPFNDIKYVSYKDMVTLLGDRFIGECK